MSIVIELLPSSIADSVYDATAQILAYETDVAEALAKKVPMHTELISQIEGMVKMPAGTDMSAENSATLHSIIPQTSTTVVSVKSFQQAVMLQRMKEAEILAQGKGFDLRFELAFGLPRHLGSLDSLRKAARADINPLMDMDMMGDMLVEDIYFYLMPHGMDDAEPLVPMTSATIMALPVRM